MIAAAKLSNHIQMVFLYYGLELNNKNLLVLPYAEPGKFGCNCKYS